MRVRHAAQASEIPPEVREDKLYVCGLLWETFQSLRWVSWLESKVLRWVEPTGPQALNFLRTKGA
jgi:hypothetical protein